MKYLKKIFESTTEDQREEIEDIFQEMLDKKYTHEDGEEDSDCHISSVQGNHLVVTIYDYARNVIVNSFKDYDKLVNQSEQRTLKLKELKKYLQRLDYAGFTWDMESDEEAFYIKVYFRDAKLQLIDAFGGEWNSTRFDETAARRVFKELYGLDYSSFRSTPATSGYYGKRGVYYIYFLKPIPEDSTISNDIRSLKKKYKYFSTARTGEQIGERNIAYTTEISQGNRLLKIELQS